ncbi:MAG: hypothetical protein AAGU14_07275 [Eubacteriaceae bacterium]
MTINKKNESIEDKPIYGKIDERTKAVVYKADSYTARFMMFAVLIDVFVRGLNIDISFFNSNWDLMLIVITGGIISTAYQIKNKVVFNAPHKKSFIFLIVLFIISAIIAIITNILF